MITGVVVLNNEILFLPASIWNLHYFHNIWKITTILTIWSSHRVYSSLKTEVPCHITNAQVTIKTYNNIEHNYFSSTSTAPLHFIQKHIEKEKEPTNFRQYEISLKRSKRNQHGNISINSKSLVFYESRNLDKSVKFQGPLEIWTEPK